MGSGGGNQEDSLSLMHIRFFGDPWPSEEKRAGVCDDDTYRVDPPVNSRCIECDFQITEDSRGVITACSPRIWGSWDLVFDGYAHKVCSYHLSCFLKIVVGGEMVDTVVEQRMRGATAEPIDTNFAEASALEAGRRWASEEEDEGEEKHNPGKGW